MLWDAEGCCGIQGPAGCRCPTATTPTLHRLSSRLTPGLELCAPPHRLEVTMIAGFSWLAGELLLPGLAVLCRDWRVLQGAVTAVLALLAACWW